MNISNVRAGDIVEVNKKGRMFFALVTERVGQSEAKSLGTRSHLVVEPITKGITYREATATEVIAHFRKMGRSRGTVIIDGDGS